MAPPLPNDEALARVHEGWDHFRFQRPLAAWASWQRALRLDPEHPAARQAIDFLAGAADLPADARAVHRFRAPRDAARRAQWNERLGRRDLDDLAEAAETFAALADDDPRDSPARYNHALCAAWMGRNAEAIASLDHVVSLQADDDIGYAVEAWSLAEILRQGAGAEPLADDLRYIVAAPALDEEDVSRLARQPGLLRVPMPHDPSIRTDLAGTSVFEWLDRPLPPPDASDLTAADLPRLLATVIASPSSLRLSSPDPLTLEVAQARLVDVFGDRALPFRREATPLPLGLLDAAVWTFRLPRGLDDQVQCRCTRDAVEHYFENLWIHAPRQGLDDRTPREASLAVDSGDPIARAKLAAIVRIREQLGARSPTARLYQGYPFDRLRRRLGLTPNDPATVDPGDCASMGGKDLGRLDPATLDDPRLAEAYQSASSLRDESASGRFAAELVRRDAPSARARFGLPSFDPTGKVRP